MKTLLIYHAGAETADILTRWLAASSDLVGLIELREAKSRKKGRVRREIERIGRLRFLDVVAFRLYYRLFLAAGDRRAVADAIERTGAKYPPLRGDVPKLVTRSPNTKLARAFIEEHAPDVMIARCKMLIKSRLFNLPKVGTFVLHPGICPEYRNAHGCFWALANRDLDRVGLTMLKIDEGVDTGPIYGYFTYEFDEKRESHHVIQTRVVLENLDEIAATLRGVSEGTAKPIEVEPTRASGVWGQPWLTRHLVWKLRARRV